MFFSTVLLLASFSAFPVLAAPIPGHLKKRAESGGWPATTGGSAKSSFGISGGFKDSYLGTFDGGPVLIANYPKGSYAGAKDIPAGFIFEASGGPGADLNNAKEAKLSYEVQFPEDFEFDLAGKLPGLCEALQFVAEPYGGSNPTIGKTCSGGRHNDGCWSARLMWRKDGAGELYAYLPTKDQKLAVCKGKCDVKYGASIGTGNWTFHPGEWTQLSERVKLNDVGKMNGEIEVFAGNKSVIFVDNLELRGTEEGRIDGAMVHTFFGG
ncbi:hypothetical protein C0991_006430, partial [Blastosporella zonata]